MNEKIKNLWVKALRSGEFEQGYGCLEKKGKYCALGVLSVLALLDGECTYSEDEVCGRFDNKKFFLSYNVMRWAGFKAFLNEGKGKSPIKFKGKLTSIAELNDEGKSFKELANIIEKIWKEL